MADIPELTLSDGTWIPQIGLGTYSLNGTAGADAVAGALRMGYRLLDTALGYGNEDAVGEGVRRSGIPRDEIVVTSKVPDDDHGYGRTRDSVRRTLDNLALERVDLQLIHWPAPERDLYVETWRALIELKAEGLIRSIGVSNFDRSQMQRLIDETGVAPVVNQIPVHVFEQQERLRRDDADLGVVTQSYSPQKHGDRMRSNEVLLAIGEELGVTPGQVALRWNVQLGAVPIPRSRDAVHQRENLGVFGFSLDERQMGRIAAIRS
jgi:diketogulonate reductase-like aldo/keto reductase